MRRLLDLIISVPAVVFVRQLFEDMANGHSYDEDGRRRGA